MASLTIEKDPLTGIPLQHFSFILNRFLPTRYLGIAHALQREEKLKGEVLAADIAGFRTNYDFFFSGSKLEGLNIPCYTHVDSEVDIEADVDWMVISKRFRAFADVADFTNHRNSNETPLLMDGSQCKDGFVRLRVLLSGDGKDEPEVWLPRQDLFSDLPVERIPGISQVIGIQEHGPAKTVDTVATKKSHVGLITPLHSSDDVVFAIRCGEWPNMATEWTTRTRPSDWPDVDLIGKVTSTGCHLVQVAHPGSPHPDEDWRLSFSMAEQTLARSLSVYQRKCYILLKITVCSVLGVANLSAKVSTYHMKTIFLWTCDIIPMSKFTEETTGARYFDLLDKLIECFEKGDLPNYFVRRNNMIGHFSTAERTEVKDVLKRLRNLPLKTILQFDGENKFRFSIKDYGIGELLNLAFNDQSRIRHGRPGDDPDKTFSPLFQKIISLQVERSMYEEAIDSLTAFVTFKKNSLGMDMDIQTLIEEQLEHQYVLQHTDPSIEMFFNFCLQTLSQLEAAQSAEPGSKRPAVVLDDFSRSSSWSSLARFFLHEKFKDNVKYSVKANLDLDCRIRCAFLEAITLDGKTPKDVLDFYSWLLFQQHEAHYNMFKFPAEIIHNFLQRLVGEIQKIQPLGSVEEFIKYEQDESYLLFDPLMKSELDNAGHLRIPTIVYARYLTTVQAIMLHGRNSDEVSQNIIEMMALYREYSEPKHCQAFAILAYAWMYRGIFEEAVNFFYVALLLGNDSAHTTRNMHLCLGVAIHEHVSKHHSKRSSLDSEEILYDRKAFVRSSDHLNSGVDPLGSSGDTAEESSCSPDDCQDDSYTREQWIAWVVNSEKHISGPANV